MTNIRLLHRYSIWPVLVLALFFGASCAGTPEMRPTLLDIGRPQALPERATLMPVLDSRHYGDRDTPPDINKGVTVLIPADRFMEAGEKAWRQDGFWDRIVPFKGAESQVVALPPYHVPFREMDTDLALSLNIRDVKLEKAGHNAFLPPHALVDAALLPVFAAGVLSTGGHLDLGARVFPSARVRLTAQVDLDAYSRMGDGLILKKSYLVRLIDPAVSEQELYPGFRATPEDGQAVGQAQAPELAREVFRWMARDPELQMMPAFARVAWLERVLAEPLVSPDKKLALVNEAAKINQPEFSAEDLESLSDPRAIVPKKIMTALGPPEEFAVNLERARGQVRLFEATTRAIINEAGRLDEKWATLPLSPAEMRLRERLDIILTQWAAAKSARNILIKIVQDDQAPWSRRRAALVILSRRLESADSEKLVQAEIDKWKPLLGEDGPQGLQAAAFMAAAQGPALKETISRDKLFRGLYGDDRWAAPRVLFAVNQGYLGPEVVRLVGAMSLDQALPNLLRALEATTRAPLDVDNEPKVALFAGGDQSTGILPAPDPVVIAKALAGFPGRPEVVRALRKLLDQWQFGVGVNDDLCAEAIRSLGRVGDKSSARPLLKIWTRLAEENRHGSVRRAAMEALADLGDSRTWAEMLKTSDRLSKGEPGASEPLVETALFLGRIRYAPAVSFLGRLAEGEAGNPLGAAGFQSLARLTNPEAQRILENLSRSPEPLIARAAEAALETSARNQAMLNMLERS